MTTKKEVAIVDHAKQEITVSDPERISRLEMLVTSLAMDNRRIANALEKFLENQSPITFKTIVDHVYKKGKDGFCKVCGAAANQHLQGVRLNK